MIDHLQAFSSLQLGRLLRIRLEEIDTGDTGQKVETQLGIIPQEGADVDQTIRSHLDPGIDGLQVHPRNLVAEFLLQAIDKILSAHRNP